MDLSSGILKNFVRVVDLLNDAEIPFCVAGGIAVSILSRPRATEDLDFLIGISKHEQNKLEAIIRGKLPVLQVKEQTFTLSGISIWRIILASPEEADGTVIVDFLFADSEFLKSALNRSLTIKLGGVDTPIISPEDLMLMKMLAGRPQDLNDIAVLRETHADDLDKDYISSWQVQLGLNNK